MAYKYLNIRFDSKYSMYKHTMRLIEFIKTIPELKQTDKVQFKNADDYPWGVISLIKCDKHGNFSLNKRECFAEVNLIEILFFDTDESLKHYLEIGTRIANKMNWEIVDEDTDEILIPKK